MIPLLHIMQQVCSHYHIILTSCYIIIIKGTIVTHYYTFQSSNLADVHSSISKVGTLSISFL